MDGNTIYLDPVASIILCIVWILAIVGVIVSLKESVYPSEWHERVFCPCGWSDRPSFGNSWFTKQHYPVCPKCGESTYDLKCETTRWKKGKWEKKEV